MTTRHFNHLSFILSKQPNAISYINGGVLEPQIRGKMCFWQTQRGVLIAAEILGLKSSQNPCESSIFGFHIHEGESCSGENDDAFSDTMGHYNPNGCPHAQHAGDLPPLFENNGYAFLSFLTNRFTVSEIVGKTVVIHSLPDDFTTQPSGNSGEKIACGEIFNLPSE